MINAVDKDKVLKYHNLGFGKLASEVSLGLYYWLDLKG